MEIRFYNSRGSITFSGRYREGAWCMTACEGLAFSGKTFQTARFGKAAGCSIIDSMENQRTVTISGDICTSDLNFTENYSNSLAVLGDTGTLEIKTALGIRKTEAVCSEFAETGKNKAFRSFCVQFICENPFFESETSEEFYIYKTIPKLNGNFTFPGVFSQRIASGTVFCAGSAACEPIFFIDTGTAGGKLTVSNKTTGEKISIDYTAMPNELITLDVKKRTVTSSLGKDLTNLLSDDSFFDGFTLIPGENELEAQSDTADTGICVVCRFRPLYREAAV